MSLTYEAHYRVRLQHPAYDLATIAGIANPGYQKEVTLPVSSFSANGRVSEPGQFSAELQTNVDYFGDLTDFGNPLRERAPLFVDRAIAGTSGAVDWSTAKVAWRGSVTDLGPPEINEGRASMQIGGLSKLHDLQRCVASIHGKRTGAMNTPTLDVDQCPTYRVEGEGFSEWAEVPEWDFANVWLPTSYHPVADDLTLAIPDGTNTDPIELGTTNQGFRPFGYVVIDEGTGSEELIAYSGYTRGTDGVYRLNNPVRGVAGTTGAAHATGTGTVKQAVPRTFATTRAVYMEKQVNGGADDGTFWPLSEFVPNPKDGYFSLQYDARLFKGEHGGSGSPPWDNLRATFATLNDNSASALTVGAVIRMLLEEPKADNGPGWVEGVDFEIDALLDDYPIARFAIEKPVTTWKAIETLLVENGLSLSPDQSALVASENPETGIIYFGFVSQTNADTDPPTGYTTEPDLMLFGTLQQGGKRSMGDTACNVCVAYEPILKTNLLAPDRSWSPASGDTMAGLAVEKSIYQDGELGLAEQTDGRGRGWIQVPITVDHSFGHERIYDDNFGTAWGIQTDDTGSAGVGPMVPLVNWFPDLDGDGQPDPVNLRKVEEALDLGWTMVGTGSTNPQQFAGNVHVETYGLTGSGMDFSDPDNPVWTDSLWPTGNLIRLSGKLEARFNNYPSDVGNMNPFVNHKLEADDIGITCVGLVLKYDVPPRRKLEDGAQRPTMAVRHMRAEGPRYETVLIQSTATDGLGYSYVFAPYSDAIFRGADSNAPITLNVQIGPSSPAGAISIGVGLLLQALAIQSEESYTVNEWERLPLLGREIIGIADSAQYRDGAQLTYTGSQGLVWDYAFHAANGRETGLEMTLRDYRKPFIGDEQSSVALTWGRST